jgi:SulP family sulfate permease
MVGFIAPAFVNFQMPKPQTEIVLSKFLVDSLLLACIALLEHVANVKLYAERGGYQVSISSDLVAVGLSNIFGAMSGSFIVAGGFSRSALNAKAVSQISLLLSVFVSLAVVYTAAPLLSMLPDAVLSVVLFIAVIGLVDWKTPLQLARLRRNGLVDALALAIAFSATCFLGVVQGMASAIGFSLVVFVFNSSYPQIVELERSPGTTYYSPAPARTPASDLGCMCAGKRVSAPLAIKVLRFEAPLWFANSALFLDRMLLELSTTRGLKALVLDMSTVPRVDYSAGLAIKKLIDRGDHLGITIVFTHANRKVESMIQMVAGARKSSFFETNYCARMALITIFAEAEVPVEDADSEERSEPELDQVFIEIPHPDTEAVTQGPSGLADLSDPSMELDPNLRVEDDADARNIPV